MNVSDFIGKVVALHLRNELAGDRGSGVDGTARYIIDCLSRDQTAAIAKCIVQDSVLSAQTELKLPDQFLEWIRSADRYPHDKPGDLLS